MTLFDCWLVYMDDSKGFVPFEALRDGYIPLRHAVMFRMNGTSRWSTWMCGAKPIRIARNTQALDSGSCFVLPSPSLDSITNMAQASLSTGIRSHLLPVCEGLNGIYPSLALA